jgi:hypothetical protein
MYQQIKPMFEGQPAQCIKRIADNAFIPFDPQNTDFAEYLKWVEAGNAPIGADTPLPSDSVADTNN